MNKSLREYDAFVISRFGRAQELQYDLAPENNAGQYALITGICCLQAVNCLLSAPGFIWGLGKNIVLTRSCRRA